MKAIRVEATPYNKQDERWEGKPNEELFWPRVMWADCGTTTGVAVMWFDPIALMDPRKPTVRSLLAWYVTHVTGPENRQAYEMSRLVRGLGGGQWETLDGVERAGEKSMGLAVGAEKFAVRTVNGTEDFLSSPRIASKLEYQLWCGTVDHDGVTRKRPLLWQMPSEIDKSEKGDTRLKNMGLWVPGADHRRDALKHTLVHLGKIRTAGLGAFEQIYGWDEDWEL